MRNKCNELNTEELIMLDVKRLSEKFGKSFLDCDEIAVLMGVGRDNARELLKSRNFPVVKIGRRQVVYITSFVAWLLKCDGALPIL